MANSLMSCLEDDLAISLMLAAATALLNIKMSLVSEAYFLLSVRASSSFITRSVKNWLPRLAMSRNADLVRRAYFCSTKL